MKDKKTESNQLTAIIDAKFLSKFKYICDCENKTTDEQLENIIKNYVYDYELTHGVISPLNLIKNAREKQNYKQ